MKLWAVVEKVETDLNTAEEQYKDEMLEEQGQFSENISFISNHVNRLSAWTDMAKVLHLIPLQCLCDIPAVSSLELDHLQLFYAQCSCVPDLHRHVPGIDISR